MTTRPIADLVHHAWRLAVTAHRYSRSLGAHRSSPLMYPSSACLSTTAATGRPSKSRPSGPRRSPPSSRAIDSTVRGFGRGASLPLASREFKRYFHRSNVAFDDGGHSGTGRYGGHSGTGR